MCIFKRRVGKGTRIYVGAEQYPLRVGIPPLVDDGVPYRPGMTSRGGVASRGQGASQGMGDGNDEQGSSCDGEEDEFGDLEYAELGNAFGAPQQGLNRQGSVIRPHFQRARSLRGKKVIVDTSNSKETTQMVLTLLQSAARQGSAGGKQNNITQAMDILNRMMTKPEVKSSQDLAQDLLQKSKSSSVGADASVEDQAMFDQMMAHYSTSAPKVAAAPKQANFMSQKSSNHLKNAVRGMIFASRLNLRRKSKLALNAISNLSDPVMSVLRDVDQWSFDVWKLSEVTDHHPLSVLAHYLFQKLGFIDQFDIDPERLALFFKGIEEGYKENPYHNRVHAADVLQNVYFMLTRDSVRDKITIVDRMAGLFAAAIHDYGHPGVNNAFLNSTSNDLSIRYNDLSTLENMHVAESYAVLHRPGHNFLENVDHAHVREIRETVVAVVLATDMSHHFGMLAELKSKIATKRDQGVWFSSDSKKDRLTVIECAVHTSDLGNPSKQLRLYRKWTEKLFEEFYQQGDKERNLGMTISPMMDRERPNMEKSQVFFIDVIVLPLFETVAQILPEMQLCVDSLNANKKFWQDVVKHLAAAAPPPE